MTKTELEDKYFAEFLRWCSDAPEGASSQLVFWLDRSSPTVDNFWEWVARYKKDIL